MAEIIVPLLFLAILGVATIKNIPAYSYFASGVKQAVDLVWGIFPYLTAILVMAQLFRASGLSLIVANALAPVLSFLGIPVELGELLLLRPFTGSGSLALLDQVLAEHGPDSYTGRCASAIVGSSDTVFYISVVYFATSKIKKFRFAIPLALLVNLFSAVLTCFLCRYI